MECVHYKEVFMEIELVRYVNSSTYTLGLLFVNKEFTMYTLERPWLANRPWVSCIPEGEYKVVRLGDRERWEVLDVKGRTNIQIHVGNRVNDSQGCILVGLNQYSDMVTHSQDAIDALLTLPAEFNLKIRSMCHGCTCRKNNKQGKTCIPCD